MLHTSGRLTKLFLAKRAHARGGAIYARRRRTFVAVPPNTKQSEPANDYLFGCFELLDVQRRLTVTTWFVERLGGTPDNGISPFAMRC